MKKLKNNIYYLIIPLLLFYMEVVLKLYCFENIPARAFLYTGLFSLSIGFGVMLLCSFFSKKFNWILLRVILGLYLILCSVQIVYYSIFKTFGTLYSAIEGMDAVAKFWSTTLTKVQAGFSVLLLLLIPYILFLILGRRHVPEKKNARTALAILAGGLVAPYLLAVLLIVNDTSGILPVRYVYCESFIPDLTVAEFGAFTTLRLDAQSLLFGHPLGCIENGRTAPEREPDDATASEFEEPVYAYNVKAIDFDALIETTDDAMLADMHRHFRDVEPTRKNEYTGLFAGKNLIWVVGEGFSTLALNEIATPTLSGMAREGFVFENFYNPIWGVSTSDGEYMTLTGLIPKSGVWSFKESAKNSMPYGFGNLLGSMGYSCKAYHNHYYNYYSRHLSHPNLGYEYKGLGSGLEIKETWPESDLEMMQLTIPEDIKEIPFHTYYMTVSGHLNYTFRGNYIAAKNRAIVENLPYTEGPKAYLACNAELDKAMAYLLDELADADLLEETVIVLSGDHYPYGLETEAMAELAGHTLEERFEKYKSTLIIWSGSMKEPIPIKKVCSSLDVMPTLANLFGIEYDSRLLIGQDILSDSEGLVEFSDFSFLTDMGRYDSKSNLFTALPGINVSEDYPQKILKSIRDSFAYSAKILDMDYYRVAF